MEYEKNFWLRAQVPTGLDFKRPKRVNLRAIPETQYEYLLRMRDSGVEISEMSRLMGYSPYCISNTLKRIDGLK